MSSIEKAMERKRRSQAPDATEQAEALAEAPPAESLDALRTGHEVAFDLARLREQGLLTPDSDQRELHEQYRLVKRQLINHAFTSPPELPNPANLIQVTSSILNEGKTFTVFNLGMSIAMERDYTVLLVDCDLSRGSLSSLVGLGDSKGLTDLLTGEVDDLGEILYRTEVPRLAIIPSGRQHPHSTELIASDGMRRLTREMASRYPDRLVIFDSTPLLMDSQAATLAEHMGQVLLVVEAGRTQQRAVREAAELLDTDRSKVAVLLNKSARGLGYGYYGGY